jgi:prepilin-type N-terminal cleavage/methylation domain-containing protein
MSCRPEAAAGFTLLELMVALLMVSLVSLGVLQITQAATGSFRLQHNLAALQENARFALQIIRTEASQAGFSHRPWQAETVIAAVAGSMDNVSARGDRLVLRRWSDRNCFENGNPASDAGGQPQFYLRVNSFEVSASGQLSLDCRYGPGPESLVRQVNRLGLVENVTAMHVLFAEDSDADGNADRWVRAGNWSDESNVLGIQLGLLLDSPERVDSPGASYAEVLGEEIGLRPDGRLRKVFEVCVSIEGRKR